MTTLIWVAVGFVFGLVVTGTAVLWMMRHKMVVATRSTRTFEDTCEALEATIDATKGWGLPIGTWDLFERFKKKNVIPSRFKKLKIYFLCNSALASRVVNDTPTMAGILPCSWSVYELEDGSVWISRMNIGMMAMIFSGVIGAAMREVEETDQRFLAAATGATAAPGMEDEDEAA